MNDSLLTIQQAADILGVSTKTLRRWDKAGTLIPQRTSGNQRRYAREQVDIFKKKRETPFGVPQALNSSQVPPSRSPFGHLEGASDLLNRHSGEERSDDSRISLLHGDKRFWASQNDESVVVDSFTRRGLAKLGRPSFFKITILAFCMCFLTGLSILFLLQKVGKGDVVLAVREYFLGPRDVILNSFQDLTPDETRSRNKFGMTKEQGQVLQAATTDNELFFNVNIPSKFAENVEFLRSISVAEVATLSGGIITNNADIDAGTGTLTVSNVLYDVIAGAGIAINESQTPTITNTDLGSSQNIFKTIKVGSSSFSAGSNTDTLEFASGTGISLSTDTTNKKVTITGSAVSGFTDDGTVVRLTTSTDNVGIGTTSPSTKLHVVGNVTFTGTTALNGVTYTWPSADGSSDYILRTDGSGTLSWIAPGGTINFWQRNSGGLSPFNITDDLLLGATSTTSAKFGLINVAGGTPTATISANSGNNATFLTGAGNLATTNRQTLTIGNSSTYNTTGNVLINPNGTGNVGIGTTNPDAKLEIEGGDLHLDGASGSHLNLIIDKGGASLFGGIVFQTAGVSNWEAGTPDSDRPWADGDEFFIGPDDTDPKFLIETNGNVGIGTTTPLELLHVAGNATASGNLTLSGAARSIQTTAGNTLSIGGTTTGLVNVVNKSGSTFTTFDTVNSRVGIGTVSPTDALDVIGSVAIDGGSELKVWLNEPFNRALRLSRPSGSIGKISVDANALQLEANGGNIVEVVNSGSSGSFPAFRVTGSNASAVQTVIRGAASQTADLLQVQNSGGTSLVVVNATGNVGIGTATPLATLDIRGTSGTIPVASVSGQTSFASFLVDNDGVGDLFTASKSGATKFTILNNGNLSWAGTTTVLSTLASAATAARTWTFPDETGTICMQSSANCGFAIGSTTNWWNSSSGALYPVNSTLDLLAGGQASASAKFAVLNLNSGTPTASVSAGASSAGGAYLTAAGTLQTTQNQTLTLGGNTTGLVQIAANSGSVYTTFDTVNSRVGIGTSSPTDLLTLRSDSAGATVDLLRLENLGSATVDSAIGLNFYANRTTGGSTNFAGFDATITSIDNTNYAGKLDINLAANGALATLATFGNPNVEINRPLSVTVGGDVGIDYDLFFTNTGAANITSEGSLSILAGDANHAENLTLGTQGTGDVVIDINDAAATTGGFKILGDSGYVHITTRDGQTGIGTISPLATLDVRPNLLDGGTVAIASASGATSFAALLADNTGVGDLFTASKSGATKFTILNNGNLSWAGTTTVLSTLASAATAARTWTFPDETGTICMQSSANCGFAIGSTTNWWNSSSGALYPVNSTLDLLAGGQASASAKFAVLNLNSGTPTASVSAGASSAGGAYLTAAGTLQTTQNQTLTLGGNTTGLVQIAANSGSVYTTFDTVNSRVGIGTTSPAASLNIGNNGTFRITRTDNAFAEFEDTDQAALDDDLRLTVSGASGTNYYLFTNEGRFAVAGGDNGFTPNASLEVNRNGSVDYFHVSTASDALGDVFKVTNAGNVGIGTTTPLATLDIRGTSGTIPVASVSGQTSFASFLVDNDGVGDIFTASKSGETKFLIRNNGVTAISMNGTATANGICHSGANVDVATNEIRDLVPCSGAPADLAEWYEVKGEANAGDVMGVSDETFTYQSTQTNPLTGEVLPEKKTRTIAKLEKSSAKQNKIIGIVSTSPWRIMGGDIRDQGSNPKPIALSGRTSVKVSTENGAIEAGDFLTTSSTPGVAMKATRAGVVIGKALEEFGENTSEVCSGRSLTSEVDRCVGKIMVFVNLTWHDPTIYIAADGNLVGLNQESRIKNQELVSSPMIHDSYFMLQDGSSTSSAQATFDLGNNQLFKDLTDKVALLENRINNLVESSISASTSALLSEIQESSVGEIGEIAPAAFDAGDIRGIENAIVSGSLAVLGRATLTDIGVTGNINAGLLSINGLEDITSEVCSGRSLTSEVGTCVGATINTLSGNLYLQNRGLGGIDILDGKIVIDTKGNMTVAGTLTAEAVEAEEFVVKGKDSIGTATIPIGTKEIEVTTPVATSTSKIFLTATSNTTSPLTVSSKSNGKFKVAVSVPQPTPVTFDWWVVGNNN